MFILYSVQFNITHSDSFNSIRSCNQRPSCQTEIEPSSWYECMCTPHPAVCVHVPLAKQLGKAFVHVWFMLCSCMQPPLFFFLLMSDCGEFSTLSIKIHHEVYFILPLCKAEPISWCQQVLPFEWTVRPAGHRHLCSVSHVVCNPPFVTSHSWTVDTCWSNHLFRLDLSDFTLLFIGRTNPCENMSTFLLSHTVHTIFSAYLQQWYFFWLLVVLFLARYG